MEWDSERIIFNPEWNYFCFRKDPVKQKPGERKGQRKEKRGRETEEERKKKKGREKERNINDSKDVNYPIKQLSLNSKNRNRNVLSHILIAFDGTKNKKTHLHIMFRSPGQHNKISWKN